MLSLCHRATGIAMALSKYNIGVGVGGEGDASTVPVTECQNCHFVTELQELPWP